MAALRDLLRRFIAAETEADPEMTVEVLATEEELRQLEVYRFHSLYDKEIDKFFAEHPDILHWEGHSPDSLWVTIPVKDRRKLYSFSGHLILDEAGRILRFEDESGNFVLERVDETLQDEVRIADLANNVLVDNEHARKYCEDMSSLLLDKGSAVFNAPIAVFGSDGKEQAAEEEARKKFSERYYDESWIYAWKKALERVFSISEVMDVEGMPYCFRLKAE